MLPQWFRKYLLHLVCSAEPCTQYKLVFAALSNVNKTAGTRTHLPQCHSIKGKNLKLLSWSSSWKTLSVGWGQSLASVKPLLIHHLILCIKMADWVRCQQKLGLKKHYTELEDKNEAPMDVQSLKKKAVVKHYMILESNFISSTSVLSSVSAIGSLWDSIVVLWLWTDQPATLENMLHTRRTKKKIFNQVFLSSCRVWNKD